MNRRLVIIGATSLLGGIALTDSFDRSLYIWGDNTYKVVDPKSEEKVFKKPSLFNWNQFGKIIDVAAHEKHAGDLHQWGTDSRTSHDTEDCKLTLNGHKLTRVLLNSNDVFVMTRNNEIYKVPLKQEKVVPDNSWFAFWYGSQKGLFEKVKLNGLERSERVVDFDIGEHHIVAITNNGRLFTGALNDLGNVFGQLGNLSEEAEPLTLKNFDLDKIINYHPFKNGPQDMVPKSFAKQVELNPLNHHEKFSSVACGDYHSLVIAQSGKVYSFGSNDSLQLGIGEYAAARKFIGRPFEVKNLWKSGEKEFNERCSKVAACGLNSAFVIESDDYSRVHVAGFGLNGQLGNGLRAHQSGTLHPPVLMISDNKQYSEVTKKVEPVRCKDISVGQDHVCAVMDTPGENGDSVYVWGSNRFFQLGVSGKRNFASPIKPPTLTDMESEQSISFPYETVKFRHRTEKDLLDQISDWFKKDEETKEDDSDAVTFANYQPTGLQLPQGKRMKCGYNTTMIY